MNQNDRKALAWMQRYLRYTDYLGAAMLYLQDNFLLKEELKPKHFKPRILGHWGTVPGLNFIYANLNYLIYKHKCEMLLITGPGHGAPAILANAYAEGALNEYYKGEYPLNLKGLGKLLKDFSWPHSNFPSHITPTVPGSILEGGELGYSLATAFGAVFDNPDLIATAIIGDGEAETGALAGAWHSNKFLNPKTSGAVLPIVHINGYKISNPTIYSTMDNRELSQLFEGYGYEPMIVEAPNIEIKMIQTLELAYQRIREIQKSARKGKNLSLKPKWPVILLRTQKGWRGLKNYNSHPVEGSFYSHGIPVDNPQKDKNALKVIQEWLSSYKINQLVNENGQPEDGLLEFIPPKSRRICMCKHAFGGNIRKNLNIPSLSKYEVKFDKSGNTESSPMIEGSKFLRDLVKNNSENLRIFCPDEIESNKMRALFEVTKRSYMWPIPQNAENTSTQGRVMEMLSEQTLQGWLQGYLLTGRHGLLASYEAFLPIISSMVDQHAKFLKQSFKVKWRKPISNAIYLLTSNGWRQDHNGYSHQNPSFISNLLLKHGKFCKAYFPPDANSFLVALEETFKDTNSISAIVAGKTPLPNWLTLKQAQKQAKLGIGIWDFITPNEHVKNPDVVLASAGDYVTQEAVGAIKMCSELIPELKIRYVNVSEITAIGLGDFCTNEKSCLTEAGVNHYFTQDRNVIFNYHGYVNDIEQVLWPYSNPKRFIIHGYKEEGSTTTPFDLKMANQVSRYHLVLDLITHGAKFNKAVAKKGPLVQKIIAKKINQHQQYICEFGDDPKDINDFKW